MVTETVIKIKHVDKKKSLIVTTVSTFESCYLNIIHFIHKLSEFEKKKPILNKHILPGEYTINRTSSRNYHNKLFIKQQYNINETYIQIYNIYIYIICT